MIESDGEILSRLYVGGAVPPNVKAHVERARRLYDKLGGGDFSPQVLALLVAQAEMGAAPNIPAENPPPPAVPAAGMRPDNPFVITGVEVPVVDVPEGPGINDKLNQEILAGLPKWCAAAVPGKTRLAYDRDDEGQEGVFVGIASVTSVYIKEDDSDESVVEVSAKACRVAAEE